MPLHLYRRHYDNGRCFGGHPPNTQTYESDELRPRWKKCGCPIYASGRLGENPKFRKNTKCCTWSDARVVAELWERGTLGPQPPDSPTPAPAKRRISIEDAAEACQKYYRTEKAADGTQDMYKCVLKKLCRFASHVRGYVYLDQWQRSDSYELKTWFGISVSGSRTYMAQVKSFFEFCIDQEWLEENPATIRINRRLKVQRILDKAKPRWPFTDEEIRRMLEAALRYTQRQGRRSDWGGQDLYDFILISTYTGLRISDVAQFEASRLLADGQVRVRTIKNVGDVHTWVPPAVQERIRARAAQYGTYIFGQPVSSKIKIVTSVWRKRLDKFWELNGPWERHPTHHRFRHTFCRILLEKGVPALRVAELIGDTEEVVLASYGTWCKERQDAIRNVLENAFSERRLFAVK